MRLMGGGKCPCCPLLIKTPLDVNFRRCPAILYIQCQTSGPKAVTEERVFFFGI